ncbi:MaoC/PaaZ C-terminal domain-containing protein [Chloroflexota bacterium]
MTEQVYWEDVQVEQEIPSLIKRPTTQQLVKWAGAAGDYFQAHYDKEFAIKAGFDGVIVHGWLNTSFLGQLLTDWSGEQGRVKKITVQYRGTTSPGENIICKGRVTNKYEKDGKYWVELEVWSENEQGKVTTPGTALVQLPSKN